MRTPTQPQRRVSDAHDGLAAGSRGGPEVFHYEVLEAGTIARFWLAAAQNTSADPDLLVPNGDSAFTGDCQLNTRPATGTWFDDLAHGGL